MIVVVRHVSRMGCAVLLEVIDAGIGLGTLARTCKRRHEDTGKDGNNCYNNKELYKGKALGFTRHAGMERLLFLTIHLHYLLLFVCKSFEIELLQYVKHHISSLFDFLLDDNEVAYISLAFLAYYLIDELARDSLEI